MKRKSMLFAAAVAFLAFSVAGEARADWGFGGGVGCGGFGLGYAYGNPYATGRIPTPPYFAIHPPVYYGQAVHRTYGRSPFARGAQGGGAYYAAAQSFVPAARLVAPRMIVNQYIRGAKNASTQPGGPKLVLNPYVEENAEALAASSTDGKSAPLMIENPYFRSETEVAANQLADRR